MSICENENREMEERLVRFFQGEKLTTEEERELERWMQDAGHRRVYYRLRSLYGAVYAQRVGMKADVVKAWRAFERRMRPGRRLGRWGAWAAAVAVLLGAAWFVALHWQPVEREGRMLAQAAEELSNRVVLTLSDGRQVALSEEAGNLEERGGARMRHDGQQLSYGGQDSVAAVVYNTLSTPRGAEYCVELADGTRVWLNAGSELRYPTAFRGATREVYLSGEAFFDQHTGELGLPGHVVKPGLCAAVDSIERSGNICRNQRCKLFLERIEVIDLASLRLWIPVGVVVHTYQDLRIERPRRFQP